MNGLQTSAYLFLHLFFLLTDGSSNTDANSHNDISAKLLESSILVDIDPMKHLKTEKEYISFTIDAELATNRTGVPPWSGIDFHNPRFQALAAGLAPAHLRFGGTDADRFIFCMNETEYIEFLNVCNSKDHGHRTIYDNVNFMNQGVAAHPTFPIPLYPKDIDNLRQTAKLAQGKLVFLLNIRPHLPNGDWDPSNALKILSYIANTTDTPTVNDLVLILGNEWPYLGYKPSMKRLGKDFIDLRRTLDTLPEYQGTWILGPDVGGVNNTRKKHWDPIISSFVHVAKNISARAVTIHHYYFNGPTSVDSMYRDIKFFNRLAPLLAMVRKTINKAGGEELPLWIDETADANYQGCPGKTDRFLSTFLWLDKLGLAAENGITLLARQDFWGLGYPLINSTFYPNPDYWVSYIYKQLVGEVVLFPTMSGSTVNSTRLYAHCTATKAAFPAGSVTFFGLNLADEDSPSIQFNLPSDTIALYSLTSDGPLTSQGVSLNDKKLDMLEDGTKFPDIKPVNVSSEEGIKLPPASLFFAVVPDANVKLCL